MDVKEKIISMWKACTNKVTIVHYAMDELNYPKECKTELQKRRYAIQYVNYVIEKEYRRVKEKCERLGI